MQAVGTEREVAVVIPWPEQERIFHKRKRRAYWRMMLFLLFSKTKVTEEAYCRLRARRYYVFGDNVFHWTKGELFQEKVEEASDLLNYQIVEDERW